MIITKDIKRVLGVFAILNTVNSKVFIGSGELYSRKATIWSLLKAGKHYNQYLQKEWNQFGNQNFKFITLFECSEPADYEYLTKFEAYWIELTQSTNRSFGYNIYKKSLHDQNFVMRFELFNPVAN